MRTSFADHFSGHASEYARYRPDYPKELFRYLAELSPSRRRAWDCATGNGQAAAGLARHFEEVFASDGSVRQIESAVPHPRVRYRVAPAEDSGLEERSVDLVTVAQALHWFDLERFWKEVARVLVPEGVVAAWCYDLLVVGPDVDPLLSHLYRDIVGPYWPRERGIVEHGYGALAFPFREIDPPRFQIEKRWTLPELEGYLRTWSATRRFFEATGEDPVARIERELAGVWGPATSARTVRWKLDLRVGQTL